ncbi:MAG: hypothetical protein AAGC55_34335, partial [Myxococcota bacterium]
PRGAAALVLIAVLGACSDDGADALDGEDAGAGDAAESDIDSSPGGDAGADGGPPDTPLDGFGAITGQCGLLDSSALDSPEPLLVRGDIDFGTTPYSDDDLDLLSPGGQEIYRDGNAGGSSLYSEMFAYEVLYRCELAELLKTENEIVYDDPGPISDMLVSIAGRKVGVSVTRAFVFPPDQPYDVARARELLDDKLTDVLASSSNVSDKDRWVKQILHIMAYAPMHAESLMTAYGGVADEVKADTIVVVTVTSGDDQFLY